MDLANGWDETLTNMCAGCLEECNARNFSQEHSCILCYNKEMSPQDFLLCIYFKVGYFVSMLAALAQEFTHKVKQASFYSQTLATTFNAS